MENGLATDGDIVGDRPHARRSLVGGVVGSWPGESLLRNGLFIMATTVATSGLGLVYWVVAARGFSTAEVGRGATLISATLFMAMFTNLGVAQLLIARLPTRRTADEWSLTVSAGLTITVAASLVVGGVAAAVLPEIVTTLAAGMGGVERALVPVGVAAAAASTVLDHICVAERRASAGFKRNSAMAVVRLGLIAVAPVVAVDGGVWVLLTWVAAFVVFDATAAVWLLPRLRPGFRLRFRGLAAEVRAMRRDLAAHQAINVGAQASGLLLPIIVMARLGADESAYFYATFMVANGLFFIAPAIGSALFAEASHAPDRLGHDVRRAIRHVATLATVPAIVLLLFGDRILEIFGSDYARGGDALLTALVCAAVFDAGQVLSVAVLRARHQLRDAAVATTTALVLAVVATWLLLPSMGLVGAGVGWGVGKLAGLVLSLSYARRARHPGQPAMPPASLHPGPM